MQFGKKKNKTKNCSAVKKEWEWDWGERSNFAVIQLPLIIVLPPPNVGSRDGRGEWPDSRLG